MDTGQIKESEKDLNKAALRGEPSYIWRAGQQRRLEMVLQAGGIRCQGAVLENGCGVGMYVQHLAKQAQRVIGLEFDLERAYLAAQRVGDLENCAILCAAGETLPFPNESFDLILSHEVLEHVQDDKAAVHEMIRTLIPGGRIALFVPNRGYPFETHGVFWRGRYHFGNIPFINYLPRSLRNKLAPHVRVYSKRDLHRIFVGLPIRIVKESTIFGGYDNIIARYPTIGRLLRWLLQTMEKTPFQNFGLSHFWVIERIPD